VALAAKRRWPDIVIRTIDKGQPLSAIGNAKVVVLASPIHAILEAIPKLPAVLQPDALVIDTGSTKNLIMLTAAKFKLQQFVGGHPMAGGTSLADARADLFDGQPWFLSRPDAPTMLTRASKFVEALGAVPIPLADRGEEHDRLMAATSHLPQLTASVLMTVVAKAIGEENLKWSGPGLRDTTRLAASKAEVWESIVASNALELQPLLKAMARELDSIADFLDDPSAIRKLFNNANRAKAACK
jgi:prephenate dehydrogenase